MIASSIAERRSTVSARCTSRGQSVGDCPDRTAGLEHRCPLRDLAAAVCRHFSHGRTTGFVATELEADEIRSFIGGKTRPAWVFAAIEVWSRL